MDKTELFNRIKGKLIISCQALPGEPLYDPERTLMPYMARAAREAGSPMIRANTVRDVLGIKKETGLPVIGEGRVHTPEEAVKMLDMGAWAVIVGGAITRPLEIAGRFMKAVNGRTA